MLSVGCHSPAVGVKATPKAKSRTGPPVAAQHAAGSGNAAAAADMSSSGVGMATPSADPGRYQPLEIMTNSRQLRHIIADAWRAVRHFNVFQADAPKPGASRPAGPRVFQPSGSLVRLRPGCSGAEVEIQVLTEKMVYSLITRAADWKRITDEGSSEAWPVKDVASDMLVAPDPALPLLDGVVATPVFGRGGQLILEPGYHPGERLWHEPDPALSLPPIAEHPSLGEIAVARSLLLDELLADFPLVAASDRAHALAALLLPFVRRLIEGPTPLHLVEAPSAGSGKGLLANVISTIVTGLSAPGQVLSSKDEEARKQLTAEMVRGRPMILIDNVSERQMLDSPALASIVTATLWTDRVMGLSQMVTAPNQALWLMTGNNPRLSMELARRCVRVRLDARVDRPWLRGGFRHDPLLKWVGEHRGELMQAILTLIQAWVAAGQPRGQKRLGSFEQWAEVIGGILQVAGIKGFLDNLEEYYAAADQEGQDWREFTEAWWERWQAAPCTVGQLTEFCASLELMNMARGEGSPRSQQTRLGNALAQARDRVFGRLQLRRVPRTHHRAGSSWQLTLLDGPADAPATTADMNEETLDRTIKQDGVQTENLVPAPKLSTECQVRQEPKGVSTEIRDTLGHPMGDLSGQGIPFQVNQNQLREKDGIPLMTMLTPPRAQAGGCAPAQEFQSTVSRSIPIHAKPMTSQELSRDTCPGRSIPQVSQGYPNLDSGVMGMTLDLADLPETRDERVDPESNW